MVNVLISADSRFPISRPKIKRAIESLLREKRVTFDTEISVLICGTRKSRELAQKYFDEDTPHNVFSFPLVENENQFISPTAQSATKGFAQEKNLILGDIVVCYPLAQIEANRDDVLVDTKINELVQHGLLHLLGVHHEE